MCIAAAGRERREILLLIIIIIITHYRFPRTFIFSHSKRYDFDSFDGKMQECGPKNGTSELLNITIFKYIIN